jgi:hypothetical protein
MTSSRGAPWLAQAVYGSVAGIVPRPERGVGLATVTITSHERGSMVTVTTKASGFYVKGHSLPADPASSSSVTIFRRGTVHTVPEGGAASSDGRAANPAGCGSARARFSSKCHFQIS